MYRVPTAVAVTTALAAGGVLFGSGGASPPGAVPLDEPTDRRTTVIPGAGSLTVTLAAVPAGQREFITALGFTSSDFTSTRITTRVNGIAVPPLIAELGAQGTLQVPTPLAAPIILGPGDVFSILMENLSGVNVDMAARILGWRV
jgi:hypothetical protein